MSFIETVFEKVRHHPKRVVFPESADERILHAAVNYHNKGLGIALLIGSRSAIHKHAQALKLDLDRVGIVDPETSDDLEHFAEMFAAIRRDKGLGKSEAIDAVKQPLYFATMMLHEGNADALVAGIRASTVGILRPLFQCIRLEPGVKAASGCGLVQLADRTLGVEGVLYLADCSVIPDPTPSQLADIAVSAAKMARQLHGVKPRVAFLSYSTKGSTYHRSQEQLLAAVALAQQKASERLLEADFDGTFQSDAAIAPGMVEWKASRSSVAGKANVLIFPDLNSGNICFNLLHRLIKGTVYGPFLIGLSKPAGTLSRTCTEKEILGSAAIAALQAVEYRKLYPLPQASASSEHFIY